MQYDYLKGKLKRMRRTLYRIFKCYAQLLSIEFFFFFFLQSIHCAIYH